MVDGLGEQNGMDFLAAACTANRSTLIAYLPTPRKVTINLSRLSGEKKMGWWFNPRNGKSHTAGETPGTDLWELVPPGEEDWVLVVEDAARHLPAPGTGDVQ